MTPSGCRRESDVLRATKSGAWPDELRDHVATCPVCEDLTIVTRALNVARRQQGVSGGGVADAALVWRRAQLRARHMAAERATRPIAFVEAVALASGAAAAILLLARVWPELRLLISMSGVL